MNNLEHHYNFDEFREKVTSLICGELIFDYGFYHHHNITDPNIFFLQVKRVQACHTAIRLPHDILMFSPGYRPCAQNRGLAFISIDGEAVCFNGQWMTPSQIGQVSGQSSAPFAVIVPANTRLLITEINNLNQQIHAFCSAMVPLEVNPEYMRRLRHAVDLGCAWPTVHSASPPLGATESLFNIISELQQQIPPLRLQSLKGRSRLSRKDYFPKIITLMENTSPQSSTLEEIANELGISSKTINLWFKHYVGMPPKRFYLLLRLFSFRKALLSPSTSSVMQATADSGIDNWSRYAERYERLFGEKPSETYQRGNGQKQ